jgi:hypothetical protein
MTQEEFQSLILSIKKSNLASNTLEDGWYETSKTPNEFKRMFKKNVKEFYINPEPKILPENFKKIKESQNYEGRETIVVKFDKFGKEAWAKTTEENISSNLIFILDNEILSAPVVQGIITSGVCSFSKDDITYAQLTSLRNMVNREAKQEVTKQSPHTITCDNSSCYGEYTGPEFVNMSDVAHQFSNKMSAAVGDQLKELYDSKKYSKVDFENIEMTTEGMGSGNVIYKLKIPFVQVPTKCEAYTSFDHVGGWNHEPELNKRKDQLKGLLLEGESLYISKKIETKEGLQEHWIQWRNKDKQKDCVVMKK